jgi:type 1 glutamine amidotransferase
MNRREMLVKTAAASAILGTASFPLGWTAAAGDKRKQRVLMYTKSESFEHPVVRREGGKLSLAERIATKLGQQHDFEVTCEKDGRIFLSDTIKDIDAFLFQTQGDLCKEKGVDNEPPMPPEGKKVLLQAVADGKGFVGCHCASDTFHSKGHGKNRFQNQEEIDPYIAMVGGEFAGHGAQQRAWMHVVDHRFPGFEDIGDFGLAEEWYSLKNFAPDLHVLLVQETQGMNKDHDYQRPNYPATWARMHGKGRIFFTSLGHREDVWTNPLFQHILLGGLAWALRNANAEVPANLDQVAPKAREMPGEKKK